MLPTVVAANEQPPGPEHRRGRRSNMTHPLPIMAAATTVVINKDNNSGSLAASRRRRSSTTIKGNGVEFQIPTFYTTIDYGISSCSY